MQKQQYFQECIFANHYNNLRRLKKLQNLARSLNSRDIESYPDFFNINVEQFNGLTPEKLAHIKQFLNTTNNNYEIHFDKDQIHNNGSFSNDTNEYKFPNFKHHRAKTTTCFGKLTKSMTKWCCGIDLKDKKCSMKNKEENQKVKKK